MDFVTLASPMHPITHMSDLTKTPVPQEKLPRTDAEWRELLSPLQFQVLREKGTEPAYSGALYRNHTDGDYHCAGCGALLFKSETKYESGSGWPSFWLPATPTALTTHEDGSHGMVRVEVTCANCGGHLGHVFPDGPKQTGLRYCINSASLSFADQGSAEKTSTTKE